MKRSAALIIISLVLCGYIANARTIHVPQQYTTIQAGVDAAVAGDEVVVAPGTYDEHVAIVNEITLRSEFDGTDWSKVYNTILKPSESKYSAITIASFLKHPLIRGFTISRDKITTTTGLGIFAVGIKTDSGRATIEYNIIENQVFLKGMFQGTEGRGAGIRNVGGIIQNNIFRNNVADYGCSISGANDSIIRNNLFIGNGRDEIAQCIDATFINNTVWNGLVTG